MVTKRRRDPAARPSATQSGIPIGSKTAAGDEQPRRGARAAPRARRHARPVARRVLGAGRAPPVHAREPRRRADPEHAEHLARATSTSASSSSVTASGSCAPPTNARSSTKPAGARPAHFDDTQVQAVIRSGCARATTKPLPASGCGHPPAARPARRSPSRRTARPGAQRRGGGIDRLEQPRRGVRRQRQDHRACVERLRAGDVTAPPVGMRRAMRCRRAEPDGARRQARRDGVGPAHPSPASERNAPSGARRADRRNPAARCRAAPRRR
jgi:hypothetical protein